MKIFIFLLALTFMGCVQIRPKWIYTSSTYGNTDEQMNLHVAVIPFQDLRENSQIKKRGAMALIPLWPGYGWYETSLPETFAQEWFGLRNHGFSPEESFAKALAEEINASGLCREAYFAYQADDADMVLKGKILDTRFYITNRSYGLSVVGVFLPFFGLPAGTLKTDLSLELSCVDARTGRMIFSKKYCAPTTSSVYWLYGQARWNYNVTYAVMARGIYKNFIDDLRLHMTLNPEQR